MAEMVALGDRPEVQEKLRRRIASCDVKVGGRPPWRAAPHALAAHRRAALAGSQPSPPRQEAASGRHRWAAALGAFRHAHRAVRGRGQACASMPPPPHTHTLALCICFSSTPAADYTIFDLNSSAERPEELARPYLHSFFAAAYADYDLVIWRWGGALPGHALGHVAARSPQETAAVVAADVGLLLPQQRALLSLFSATSMKWVEVKMRELGVSTHPDYRLTCMLDHKSMVTVQHDKHGGQHARGWCQHAFRDASHVCTPALLCTSCPSAGPRRGV